MKEFLTVERLKKATGINFVSSGIQSFGGDGQTYKQLEKETESKTHREMRDCAIAYFQKLGYEIYPSGVGVKGVFALADFLAYQNGRVVFVECLTDAKANPSDVERKKQLGAFGEVCFVVVGGHGCEWENDKRKIPEVFIQLAKEVDVLTFLYGHWQNRFQKKISNLTPFPRISFDVRQSEKIELQCGIEVKRKSSVVQFEFETKSYRQEDRVEFLTKIAGSVAWEVYRWKCFRTASAFKMSTPAGKIFKDHNNKVVAQICVQSGKGLLKARGSSGLKVLEQLLAELKESSLLIKLDEEALAHARQTLANVFEPKIVNSTEEQHRIKYNSSFYQTSHIVFVLSYFFENKPTKVSDFARHLPFEISSNISYWLRRALALRDIRVVDASARLIADRLFVASDSAIKKAKHFKLS